MAAALVDAVQSAVANVAGHGVTASAALATLAAYPDEPVDALRRTLRLTAAGCSRLLDRLEAERW